MRGARSWVAPLADERGGALIISMLVMAFVAMLGTAPVYNTVSDRQISRYERDSMKALADAETGLSVAKRMVQDLTAPMTDSDGYPDFTYADTLSWGGEYSLIAEAGEIKDIAGFGAYRARGFTVGVEGRARGAVRRVRSQVGHDTFLKYARFVETTGNGYACRASISGEVYVGGDLSIPTCPTSECVTFLAGNPLNLGLVAFNDFRLGSVPRVANIDAAIMAVNDNWGAISTSSGSHPGMTGAFDLDQDGVIESGQNNDPVPGEGWFERAVDPSVWCLNMNGPLITSARGGAAPWPWYSGPGPTRRYNYDLDITEYPPPCFPVPRNLWLDVTWTEIFDVESELEDHLL